VSSILLPPIVQRDERYFCKPISADLIMVCSATTRANGIAMIQKL
jgi:hypothetical protein